MPWQSLLMVTLLVAVLVFGLVGYWRGKGIHSRCNLVREPKSKPLNR